MTRQRTRAWIVGIVAILVSAIVFLVPFAFVILQSSKSSTDASNLAFTLPVHWEFLQNFGAVLTANDGLIGRALVNSSILTIGAVTLMVVVSAMVGYVLQRKVSRLNPIINFFVLAGLIVPPAVVPTIWVLQGLGLFKTMPGMILIDATFGLSFSILLFRAF